MNRIFKAMLPKRCNKRNKDEEAINLDTGRGVEAQREIIIDPTIPCSPKKRRDVRFIRVAPTDAQTDSPIFPPPLFQHDFQIPSENDPIWTPPILQPIGSPPRLQQRNHMIGTQSDSVLPLPLLPSDLINDDVMNFAPKFKLNPRLQWNPDMISRQLDNEEQTLSSLLTRQTHKQRSISPSSSVPPRTIISKALYDFSEKMHIECTDVIKPTPRYGSATASSLATTDNYDNTTLLNTVAEESCCAWFNPSSCASAFETIEAPKKDFDKFNVEVHKPL